MKVSCPFEHLPLSKKTHLTYNIQVFALCWLFHLNGPGLEFPGLLGEHGLSPKPMAKLQCMVHYNFPFKSVYTWILYGQSNLNLYTNSTDHISNIDMAPGSSLPPSLGIYWEMLPLLSVGITFPCFSNKMDFSSGWISSLYLLSLVDRIWSSKEKHSIQSMWKKTHRAWLFLTMWRFIKYTTVFDRLLR